MNERQEITDMMIKAHFLSKKGELEDNFIPFCLKRTFEIEKECLGRLAESDSEFLILDKAYAEAWFRAVRKKFEEFDFVNFKARRDREAIKDD